MRLVHAAGTVVTRGHEKQAFVSVGLGEQSLSEEGSIARKYRSVLKVLGRIKNQNYGTLPVVVVVETVPDGSLDRFLDQHICRSFPRFTTSLATQSRVLTKTTSICDL